MASGLEEILEQIEEAADHADLDKEAKEGVEANLQRRMLSSPEGE